jgi:ketosteroid isomerase-like protein
MSSVEENNKALVRRFLEEEAKGNFDVIDELVAPDFVDLLISAQTPKARILATLCNQG